MSKLLAFADELEKEIKALEDKKLQNAAKKYGYKIVSLDTGPVEGTWKYNLKKL